jgi:tyrosine-protein kinase Etk/Wzc
MQDKKKSDILNKTDGAMDFKRYSRLFKRKKWLIFGVFSVVFILWMLMTLKFAPSPAYTIHALIQLEDRRELAAMDTRGRPENEAKRGLLRSRSFLGEVVDKLSYAVQFKNVNRADIVDSVYLAKDYLTGGYKLVKNGGNLQLFYTNSENNIKNKKVLDLSLPANRTLEYGGFKLFFNENISELKDDVKFGVIEKKQAVELLRESIIDGFRNSTRTLLRISIIGKDPYFSTKVLNTLISEFVRKNLDHKKHYTREILRILSEQLKTAQLELDVAVNNLRIFRQSNPWVGLAADASGVITNISTNEAEKAGISSRKNSLDMLLARFNASSGDAKYPVLNEILSFLAAQQAPTIPALASEFTNLTSERTRLLGAYAPEHVVVLENQKKLDELEKKVLLTASNQNVRYENQRNQVQAKINADNYKIRNLPAKELQLAELQRKRSIADQIYSSLLIRHNQAKIADAVEVGDIRILDPAVVPQLKSKIRIYLKYLIIGLFISLGISIGFVFLLEFLDKTVRTSEELEKLIPIRVIAKIPRIGNKKDNIRELVQEKGRIDPKLVTADYSPTPVGEAYRSLRTQLLFSNNNRRVKSLFVSSLNPNEGKSLNAGNIAITFAQQKLPTLLIDADLRRGVLHNSFACKKKPGLSDILYSNADITDENIRKIIQQTHIPNLYLLSSGRPVPNPSEILGGQKGREIVNFLTKRFGFVIIDTPPIMVTADSVIISQYVESGIFVINAGKTNVTELKEKINEYNDFEKRIIGLLLNYAEDNIRKDRYQYSYYNY